MGTKGIRAQLNLLFLFLVLEGVCVCVLLFCFVFRATFVAYGGSQALGVELEL